MRYLLALTLACAAFTAHADTGLAMRCDGVSVPTQAAACTGARSWARPNPTDFVLSLPTVPLKASSIAWTDPNLQFRQWNTIPGNYGVGICTKDLSAAQVSIPVGGADQCAPGADDVLKPLVAASTVQLPVTVAPVQVVSVVKLDWTAPTLYSDGSVLPLTDLTGYNIYQGTSATTLAKVGTIKSPATAYTTPVLSPGVYYFSITTTTATAESLRVTPISVQVLPPPPKVPGTPTNFRITVSVTTGQ